MTQVKFDTKARWIWAAQNIRSYNRFVCFRRTFKVKSQAENASLKITADSRYELYVNGEWMGHGPVRSFSSPWPVDEYDLCGVLQPGENVIAVLVQHFGIGTFQYFLEEPGLLAQLYLKEKGKASTTLVTDGRWRCSHHPGYVWPTPRISCQQAWEEQYDARAFDSCWTAPGYDDTGWLKAKPQRPAGKPPHEKLEARDIPFLTREVVEPARVQAMETVRTADYTWSLLLRDIYNPDHKSADIFLGRLLLATFIYSPQAQDIEIQLPHGWDRGHEWKLNGELIPLEIPEMIFTQELKGKARLKKGWNTLMHRLPESCHIRATVFSLRTKTPLKFSCSPNRVRSRPTPWLAIGPFGGLEAPEKPWVPLVTSSRIQPEATADRYESIWEEGTLETRDLRASFTRILPKEMMPDADTYALCASEEAEGDASALIESPSALQRDNAGWTTIHPSTEGDVRIMLDFGRELVGYHEFEVDAPEGTIIDNHNFEFIQRDGRINLAEGMNNSFRYTCRDGIQHFRTYVRRGFRYSYFTFRNFRRPVRVRYIRALFSSYPVAQLGGFDCSDPLLERIWEVGAHSVRCCAEDTYTDCPTYEQTHWVGDARNEALVDLVANGDPRLSRHCWVQAGRSLDRSPLTQSLVPSSWENILPAWSFLWMRWVQEHYLLTGDRNSAREGLKFLDRNVRGIEKHLNAEGLFEITAWNMFDWAPMDTPSSGVVTHQNCLAVLGLRQAADLADRMNQKKRAQRWSSLADRLSRNINDHLWSEKKKAYVDCIHEDGTVSDVFSQQTQTAAYISGVAQDDRATRCRAIIEKAPKGFVKAGSPFFMFFLLEALVEENRFKEMIDTIRSYWGVQIEQGATTFWETYHPDSPRVTRSHCHGWSAAPTFFLSQYVLGVQPLEPGYQHVLLAPRPGNLKWAQGRVPTPYGVIESSWCSGKNEFELIAKLPVRKAVTIDLPFDGKVTFDGAKMRKMRSKQGTLRYQGEAETVCIKVKRR